MFFNMSLRLLIENSLDFVIGATINLMWWDISSTNAEKASSFISVIVITLLFLVVLCSLYTTFKIHREKSLIEKY